ncbi:MAG: hypothetical protein JSR33_10925 [Proteobacteria bacterium]|nr:hypothetical protein [Pseudomonadota bacterium]
MKNKVKQFQDKLNEMELLVKEMEKELVENGDWVTAEVYSIKAHLSTLYKEIKDLECHRLCKK